MSPATMQCLAKPESTTAFSRTRASLRRPYPLILMTMQCKGTGSVSLWWCWFTRGAMSCWSNKAILVAALWPSRNGLDALPTAVPIVTLPHDTTTEVEVPPPSTPA